MKAVESAESVLFRQVTRSLPDLGWDFENKIARPVSIQSGLGQSMLLCGQGTSTVEAGERTPRFRVGDHRGTHERRFFSETLDRG